MRKIILLALFISACANPNAPFPDVSLQPYLTATLPNTATPNILTIVETALPTQTPQIYTIEAGDTISEIAEKFKISASDLRAANPDVNPNTLIIGDTILIPDPSAALVSASTPTPLPVPILQTVCHPDSSSGLHCFALIQNNTSNILENVSAKINLLDENQNVIASQIAFTALDVIPVNASLPVYVYFANVPVSAKPQVQLLSALQGNASSYVPAQINNSIAEIDGQYAKVSGQIYTPQAVNQVWVLAVAYDASGTVIGMKRWEGTALSDEGLSPFQFSVTSLSVEIEALEFFIQAKP